MERNGLNTDVGINLLFAAIERERNNSNTKQLQTSTGVYGQTLSAVGRDVDRTNLHFNGVSQAGPFANPLNGFPIAAYNQPPLLWPFLSSPVHAHSQFRQPSLQQGKTVPQLNLSPAGEKCELRCEVCGLACESIVELQEHITRKHIAAESEPLKERRGSVSKPHVQRGENNGSNTPQRKDSATSSSTSQNNGKKSSTDFPIPTPNFALLSSYSKPPSLNPPVGTSSGRHVLDPTKLYADNVLPPLLSSQLKNMPLPMLPNAYSMLNPFLAFQNMINSNGISQAVSAAGKFPPALALGAAASYPYLRYSTPSSGYLPGNLPYLPAMPVMLPQTPVTSAPTLTDSSSLKEKDKTENVFSTKSDSGAEKRKDRHENLNPTPSISSNVNYSSPHADSLRRRLSVPIISLNKDFRAPYPYSRKPSISNSTDCPPLHEQRNSAPEQLKRSHKKSLCHNVSGKKQTPSSEKPTHSHLNAKSIEQHISKLISNNEKVLLNPALERVKPRRVFRRNSLDPASLSSYAAAFTGRNTHEGLYFKEDESPRKMLTDAEARLGLSTSTRTHFPTSTSSHVNFPHGMTSSEYENMAQLARMSQSNPHLLSSMTNNDLQDRATHTAQHLPPKTSKANGVEGILGKRDLSLPSSVGTSSSAKKPRRATFFECSDCGVRYRKEDNYKIHKHMYCKYKKDSSRAANAENRMENLGQTVRQLRRHSDLPEIPNGSITTQVLDKYLLNDASSNGSPAREIVSRTPKVALGGVESNGNYTKIVAPPFHSDLYTDPMKVLHNDLCRTKSAEATLQTKSTPKGVNLSTSDDSAVSAKSSKLINCSEASHLVPCSSASPMVESSPSASSTAVLPGRPPVLTPGSSIPPSKLPPNKRHLMRLFEQGNVSSDAGQLSVAETDSSSPVAPNKLDTASSAEAKTTTSSETTCILSPFSPPSVTPSDDLFLSPAHSNAFTFDEASVPRSNYKLLLHEISLRNMQDKRLMENLSYDKSVWSWQQIQKGLLNRESSELIRRNSLEMPQGIPQNQRKFSVPSRLSRISEIPGCSFPPVLSTAAIDKLKSASDPKTISITQSGPVPDLTISSAEKLSTLPQPPLAAAEEVSSATPEDRDKMLSSSTSSPTSNTSMLVDDAREDNQQPATSTARMIIIPQSTDREEDEASAADRLSSVLYPHLRPTLVAQPHASFCCMVSPQPTCMEIPDSKESTSAQVSMYSDWAVSEPILIPPDLTISDVLTKWRRSKSGYRKGVTTTVESNGELILTEHKAYEENKEKVKEAKNKSHSPEAGDELSEDETVAIEKTLKGEEVTVPVFIPSALFKSSVKPIYACCHISQGTTHPTSDPHFALSGAESFMKDSHWSSGTSTCTIFKTQSSNLKCQDNDLATSLKTSEKADSKSNDEPKVSRGSLLPSNQQMPAPESRPIAASQSSCHATNSDSDPVDVRIEFFGKVKRRRTRRERTAASPREKRRALQCKSPLSPSAAVLPVHQSNACSSATEEKLRGCALCSMKAGRTDLITDTDSACQPCRDAALGKNDQPTVTNQKACTPLFYSPPTSTSGFLDKARASSGNTQHWVSNNTPDITEHATHGGIFRYPSPRSSKSSASEGVVDATTSLSQSGLASSIDATTTKAEKPRLAVDVSKASTAPSNKAEHSPAVVSPSLAEVVSEVMRTAAMQSKRQSKSAKRHHLLAKSRALLPESLPTSPLIVEQPDTHGGSLKTNSPAARPCTKTSTSLNPYVSSTFTYPEKDLKAEATTSSAGKAPSEHKDPCEITVTPATPPGGSPNPSGSPSPLENSDRPQEKDACSSNEKPNSLLAETNAEGTRRKNGMQASVCSGQEPDAEATYKEDASFESDEEGMKEDIEGSPANDGAARPFRCHECKVAFRIGGHLAKHLRSKGHTVAMQKKTLNRLKMRQIQICVAPGNNPQSGGENDVSSDIVFKDNFNLNSTSTSLVSSPVQGQRFNSKSNGSELLDGAEGLARSQVRALLEGSGEYACVPTISCDDVVRGDVTDDMIGSQDPRPFKCIACKVAFRFQGHLDRHFRSNAHLIAVGHYEQDTSGPNSRPPQLSNHSNEEYPAARDKKENIELREEQAFNNEQSTATSPVDMSSFVGFGSSERVEEKMQTSSHTAATYLSVKAGDKALSPHLSASLDNQREPSVPLFSPEKPLSSAQEEQNFAASLKTSDQTQRNKALAFESSGSKSGFSRLPNHQAVTQLHMHSNDQSESSVPLRSGDCLPRSVVIPCQVSCT